MVGDQYFRIIGTGHYLPSRTVSAEEIDLRLDLPRGWTADNVGVLTRYQCLPPESQVTMGCQALQRALADANLGWGEIDLILDCSTSRYRPIPCNAAHYQQMLGQPAASIPCFDVQSTCLGFVAGLQVANGLLASRTHRRIALVASEDGLAGVNWQHPQSAALIGDGAAAAILEHVEPVGKVFVEHQTWAENLEECKVDGGGHFLPPFRYTEEIRHQFQFHMNGPSLFKLALRRLPPMVDRVVSHWQSVSGSELDSSARRPSAGPPNADSTIAPLSPAGQRKLKILPHQASPRSLQLMRQKLGFAEEQFFVDMRDFGNLVAASIPTMLDRTRRDGRISAGDWVMMLGTSAGYSQVAMIFQL